MFFENAQKTNVKIYFENFFFYHLNQILFRLETITFIKRIINIMAICKGKWINIFLDKRIVETKLILNRYIHGCVVILRR